MSDLTPEAFTVSSDPTSQISALLGFLAPEEGDEAAGAGDAASGAAEPAAGQQPPAAEGAGAAGSGSAAPPAGDAGEPGVPPAAAGTVVADAPPVTTAVVVDNGYELDATSVLPKFDELATGFETQQNRLIEDQVIAEVTKNRENYVAALNQPARALVGKKVPSLSGPGEDTLRDSADAREWQEAVKQQLDREVQSKVEARQDQLANVFSTVHASIDLFRNNLDLVPGTKQFDKELADTFVAAAKDYEIRAGGKLIGYAVQVQPIINALRSQIVSRRATPAAPTPAQARAAEQPRVETGQWAPQAGLRSSAGQSGADVDEAQGVLDAFFRASGRLQ